MTIRKCRTFIALVFLFLLPGCPLPGSPSGQRTTEYTYRVVASYPHDRDAFTQGLVMDEGELFEGTGINGASSLRRVDLETGAVLEQIDLAFRYFGEGVTTFGDRIIQLTWLSHTGFVYDKSTFEEVDVFEYPTEGWGITHDGARLIMSDGTSTLYFLDPDTFERIGTVLVKDERGPVRRLNELEYIDGAVWANVWLTDTIVIIDPDTGVVTGRIDLSGLLQPEDLTEPVDVLNGIAYDGQRNRVLVTGKLWPKLFEIELVEIEAPMAMN